MSRESSLGTGRGPGGSGEVVRDAGARRRLHTWVSLGAAVVVSATLAVILLVCFERASWLDRYFTAVIALTIVIILAAAVPVIARRPDRADLALALVIALMLVLAPVLAGREVGARRSLRELADEAEIADGRWSRVIAYQFSRPSLVYYGHRDVTLVDGPGELRSAIDAGSLVVLEERRFRKFSASWQDSFRIVAAQGRFLAVAPTGPSLP